MAHLGVIECFFGPPWSKKSRLSYADFLAENGYGFYLYAPKADALLRKNWREEWNHSYRTEIKELAETFQKKGVKFGVCLSPYGTQEEFSAADRAEMKKKIGLLNTFHLDYLGVFFDDMPSSPGMAKRQLDVLNEIHEQADSKIIFCPSYYSYDPILDKVFGQRPENYLEEIAAGAPPEIELVWTGPKVISEEISAAHLQEVEKILGRKPFLCDNIFANDGPRNCKFLKIRPFAGQRSDALKHSAGWSINPMNQAEISKVLLLSAKLTSDFSPEIALQKALERMCGEELANFISQNVSSFFSDGLDKFTENQKKTWGKSLKSFSHPVADEILDWLEGKYTVGSDCLTD